MAAVQEGLMADMPVDLIKSIFGYDVPDSYDSFVSVLILIIGLWGAEKVIQRLKRAKEDFDLRRLDARASSREGDVITLRIDNEIGDEIVAQWLKLHISYAQQSYDEATMEEDRADAAADMLAMRRILKYLVGDLS